MHDDAGSDDDYRHESETHQGSDDEQAESHYRTKARKPRRNLGVFRDDAEPVETARFDERGMTSEDEMAYALGNAQQTPRTKHILRVINTRDVSQIRLLRGVGAKKAEMIVNCLCEMDDDGGDEQGEDRGRVGMIRDLGELGRLKGVGAKGVERMRAAVCE